MSTFTSIISEPLLKLRISLHYGMLSSHHHIHMVRSPLRLLAETAGPFLQLRSESLFDSWFPLVGSRASLIASTAH